MKEIVVILDNIRSTHNVGSILRSCDGFGIHTVYACGYTPYPTVENDSRLPHERKKLHSAIAKTALGAEETIEVIPVQTIEELLPTLKTEGYTIASLEQSDSSVSLPTFACPDKLALVVGNEVSGINTTILGHSDVILEIPMIGTKESFNVSVATAIALYQLKNH